MSPRLPDDELERRLRDVLHDRGLSIRPDPGALDRVHAGARRRQQRRAVTSSLGAVLIVAVAAAAIAFRPHGHTTQTAATTPTPTSSALTPSIASASPATRSPSGSASLRSASGSKPKASVAPSGTGAGAIPAGGTPPTGFVPLSVTAVSATHYWVLGHAPCDVGTCTAIATTTDDGKTFTEVGAPPSAVVADVPGNVDVYGSTTISDIRFVDANTGWAYGGGLWQTTDGGEQWDAVAMPGSVQRLAVASGRAWAVVLSGAPATSGPTYDIYTTSYPNGTWNKVGSAGSFGPAEPALAVHNTAVTVIGTDTATGRLKSVTAAGVPTFTSLRPPPCQAIAGNPISETPAGGLWLACSLPTTKLGGIALSPDFGKSFSVVSSGRSAATQAIGAVDDKSAIVAEGGKLLRLNADKSTSAVSQPSTGAAAQGWSFLGFTDTAHGFAIPIVNGSRQLWRTVDGGSHWSVVRF
jgi:hypothetical protein